MIQLDVSAVKNIPGEVRRLEMDVYIEDPDNTGEIAFESPARLEAVLANEGGALRLKGNVEGKARVYCGRCLEPFDIPVTAELDEVYYNETQQELDRGEDWIPFRGDTLDIYPEVAKSILASLPMKLICRDDCRGLCQNCGANLNDAACDCIKDDIDPRMEALKKLLEKGKA